MRQYDADSVRKKSDNKKCATLVFVRWEQWTHHIRTSYNLFYSAFGSSFHLPTYENYRLMICLYVLCVVCKIYEPFLHEYVCALKNHIKWQTHRLARWIMVLFQRQNAHNSRIHHIHFMWAIHTERARKYRNIYTGAVALTRSIHIYYRPCA